MTRFWNNIHQLITSNSKEWKVHVLRLVFELISWACLHFRSTWVRPVLIGVRVFRVFFFSIYRVFCSVIDSLLWNPHLLCSIQICLKDEDSKSWIYLNNKYNIKIFCILDLGHITTPQEPSELILFNHKHIFI
jgi:hypothetical protein